MQVVQAQIKADISANNVCFNGCGEIACNDSTIMFIVGKETHIEERRPKIIT